MKLFVIRIHDFDHDGVELDRLSEILGALNSVVSVYNRIHGEIARPRVVFLDSGSDASIGITVVAGASLLALVFERVFRLVMHRRAEHADRRVDSILKKGEAAAGVELLFKESGLSAEEREAYKAELRKGLGTLVSSGAFPPQENTEPVRAALRILGPPKHLLTAGDDVRDNDVVDDADLGDTEDEIPPAE